MLWTYCSRVIEVSPVADEAEEQLSLDAYVQTWPHEQFGLPEVQAFKASLLDHADLLAREDGAVLGSGFVALFPGLPESPRATVTVPPRHRGQGAGTALYSAISDWARERRLGTLEAVLADTIRRASRSPRSAASPKSAMRRASLST